MGDEQSIQKVAQIFGELADQGGAASDSFAAIHNILKNLVNRNFIKFGKNLQLYTTTLGKLNELQKNYGRNIDRTNKALERFRQSLSNKIKVSTVTQTQKITTKESGKKTFEPKDNNQPIGPNLNPNKLFESLSNGIKNTLPSLGKLTGLSKVFAVIQALIATSAGMVAKTNLNLNKTTKEVNKTFEDTNKKVKDSSTAFDETNKKIKELDLSSLKKVGEEVVKFIDESNLKETSEKLNDAFKDVIDTIRPQKSKKPKKEKEQQPEKAEPEKAEPKKTKPVPPKAPEKPFEERLSNKKGLRKFAEQLRYDKENRPIISKVSTKDLPLGSMQKFGKQLEGIFGKIRNTFGRIGSGIGKVAGKAMPSMPSIPTGTLANITKFGKGLGFVVGGLIAFYTALQAAKVAVDRFLINNLGKIVEPFDKLFTTVQTIGKEFIGFANTLAEFTGKLNPYYAEQLNFALDDLYAVIGSAVLPLFNEMVTTVWRFVNVLAGNLNTIREPFQKLAGLLTNITSVVLAGFVRILDSLKPVFDALMGAFDKIMPLLETSFGKIVQTIEQLMPSIVEVIGILADAAGPLLEAGVEMFVKYLHQLAKDAEISAKQLAVMGPTLIRFSTMVSEVTNMLNNMLNLSIIKLAEWTAALVTSTGGIIARFFNPSIKEEEKEAKRQEGLRIKEKADEDAKVAEKKQQELMKGFSSRGASFQQIGDLGKNLQVASFGAGMDIPKQSLEELKKINGNLEKQNKGKVDQPFDGGEKKNGVRGGDLAQKKAAMFGGMGGVHWGMK